MELCFSAKVTTSFLLFLALTFLQLHAQWLWSNDLVVATQTHRGYVAKLTFQNHGSTPFTVSGVEFSCPCVTFHFSSTTAAPGKDGTLTIFLEDSKTSHENLDALATGSDGPKPHEFTIRLPEPGK